jgi:hypothetical protein
MVMKMKNQALTRRDFVKLTTGGFAAAAVGGAAFDGLAIAGFALTPADRLAGVFMQPPVEARPWCYWYWMNGNMTQEGIQADLQGLASVGVGGVNLFDIALLPAGSVVNRSAEWYQLVRFAASEAAKRNIKVNLNCPGWSGSGGPWITPELAMQELTWSEMTVDGERELSTLLPEPAIRLGYYRDAAVIAFPTPDGDEPLPMPQALDIEGNFLPQAAPALKRKAVLSAAVMSQSPGVPKAAPAPPSNIEAPVELPVKFDLVFPHPVEVRSLYLRNARESGAYRAELFAWDDVQKGFQPLATFGSHSAGPFSSHIGSASFNPVRAKKFRLAFQNRKERERVQVEALSFSGSFRVTNWTSKVGFSTEPVVPSSSDLLPQKTDVIALEKVVDLSANMGPDGRLNWSVPSGRWTILRIGHTPTGIYLFPTPKGGAGLDCDKLSRKAADFHYDHCVKPVLRELGTTLASEVMAYYHVDSYESGWQNWTANFPQDFHERRGYDLVKYLPALTGRVIESVQTTEKFLWDFRRTIGDLFADNNYGRLAERCHEDGIGLSCEPYGGPFEQLQVGLRADHPMTEVWVKSNLPSKKLWPEAVLAGRTAGRKIVGAESFTSGPPSAGMWNTHPFSLKPLGDLIFCSGVNQYCIHVSTQQPLLGEHLRPGFTCGQNGIHFDRGNTWWHHGAKEWLTYITRCQSMLQEGEHVADVLYFQGNDSPSGVGPFNPALPDGYDLDACNSEILHDVRVVKGLIVLPCGKSYRYLVLPGHGRVTLASLRKIASLGREGARIVGTMPYESPSLADEPSKSEYEELTRELTSQVTVGRSFAEILAADKLPPDFSYDESAGPVLHYTHRHAGDMEFYFVASASPNAATVQCRFRVAGKIPELWRAVDGAMESCAVYEESGDTTRIPINFDPIGSVFVVFRSGSPKLHATAISFAEASATSMAAAAERLPCSVSNDKNVLKLSAWQPGKYAVTMPNRQKHVMEVSSLPAPKQVEGPWTVQFPIGWEAPEKIVLDKLISWPDSLDAGVRYFSGTATYKTTFQAAKVDPDCNLFLDLGRVEVIAEVWLNGKFLGTFWKPPFVCEVTSLLRPAANELEVRITNLWPNRLIGDERFPDDCTDDGRWESGVIPMFPEWLKKGNVRPESRRLTFCTWKHWHRSDALLPSGLLGPVMLRQVRTVIMAGS